MAKKATLLAVAVAGLAALFIPSSDCVKIVSLDVPAAAEAGSDDIVLDCDFEYAEEEKMQLDIKWYFNDDPQPIYQWIPGYTSGPHAISDMFKDHINLEYQVQEDEVEKHRALHIKNPLPQLSGKYTCKVSSFIDEDTKQKDLLIYAPPSYLTLDVVHSELHDSYADDPGSGAFDNSVPESGVLDFSEAGSGSSEDGSSLNVTCAATAMYPLPNTSLTWGHDDVDRDEVEHFNFRSDGLTDVSIFATIGEDEMDQILTITCTISLPGTTFSSWIKTIYYPPGMEPTTAPDPSTLEELETEGFIDHAFVDDYSASGDGSGWGSGDDPLCLESGSGVCLEDSPPAVYDPLCDESGSGVCVDSSAEPAQDPLCDESGSGVCVDGSGEDNLDPLCEGSGSGECQDVIKMGCQVFGNCAEDGSPTEETHEKENVDTSEEDEEEEKEETVEISETVPEEDSDTHEEEEPTADASAYLSKSNSVMLTVALLISQCFSMR